MEPTVPDNHIAVEGNDHSDEHTKDGAHTKPPLGKVVPFWSTIIPVLVSRQLLQSLNTIFKPFGKALEENRIQNKGLRFLAANTYSLLFGSGVAYLSAAYAKSNLRAIKTLYADPVAIELGKKREDVTYGDLLFKSKNAVVRDSVREFKNENTIRSLVLSTFFLPWHLLSKAEKKPHNIQATVGAGAMGLYTLGSRFHENESVLEALQNMVDTKMHHNGNKPYEIIDANDIGQLLVIQRRRADKSYRQAALDTTQEQQEIQVTQRIADLLNETYHNVGKDHSHFSLAKFIYLMGNNAGNTQKSFLEQPYPTNLAYVELANHHDISAVEDVAKTIASDAKPEEAFARYGISYNSAAGTAAEQTVPEQSFSAKIAQEPNNGKFSSRVKEPTSYTQRATAEPNSGVLSLN